MIGYLGPIGSYSYEAARAYDPKTEFRAFKSFYQIIKAVEDGSVDKGILPIENSTEGAVTSVMDGLLNTVNSSIIGEIVIPVRHNIISIDKNMDKIKYIYSHIQAIEQCREYLNEKYPKIILESTSSTSKACLEARERGEGYAAIANRESAEIYGLNILKENIQDNRSNQTRFIVIGKEIESRQVNTKTSIAFSCINDRPGLLYDVLREFANRDINLSRIESRPAKSEMGKYVFYIDFIGHKDEEKIKEILSHIKRTTDMLKIFGSYAFNEIKRS